MCKKIKFIKGQTNYGNGIINYSILTNYISGLF